MRKLKMQVEEKKIELCCNCCRKRSATKRARPQVRTRASTSTITRTSTRVIEGKRRRSRSLPQLPPSTSHFSLIVTLLSLTCYISFVQCQHNYHDINESRVLRQEEYANLVLQRRQGIIQERINNQLYTSSNNTNFSNSTKRDSRKQINYGKRGHPFARMEKLRLQYNRRLQQEEQHQHNSSMQQSNLINNNEGLGDSNTNRTLYDSLMERYSMDNEYKPIRITLFETPYLEQARKQSSANRYKIHLLLQAIMAQVIEYWSLALKVFPVQGQLMLGADKDRAQNSCGSIAPEEHLKYGVPETDLAVYITANVHCRSKGNLASALGCDWDQYYRPIAGDIDFCLDQIDLESEDGFMKILSAASHELAHLFGFNSFDMVNYHDPTTGQFRTPNFEQKTVQCVDGQKRQQYVPAENTLKRGYNSKGAMYFEVATPTVTQVARNHFDCQEMTGARLENQEHNANECFGAHWDEVLYPTHMMSTEFSKITASSIPYINPLTLALFEDTGWYKPNYSMSKPSPYGHGAGCGIINQPCITPAGDVPDFGKGLFCNTPELESSLGCDPTHSQIGTCDLLDYDHYEGFHAPPPQYQYFADHPSWGSFRSKRDYCPSYSDLHIDCRDGDNVPNDVLTGERFGSHSKCFETNGFAATRPACFKTRCNTVDMVLEVILGNIPTAQDYVRNEVNDEELRSSSGAVGSITCDFDGQTHMVPGSDFQFSCPPLAVVCPELVCPGGCSGKGICDYNKDHPSQKPKCKCFDELDTTLICSGAPTQKDENPSPSNTYQANGKPLPQRSNTNNNNLNGADGDDESNPATTTQKMASSSPPPPHFSLFRGFVGVPHLVLAMTSVFMLVTT